MNELLARAGSVFVAPAPAAVARRAPAPPPDLVGVLAAPADLACVAGATAATVRRRHRTRAVLVCGPTAAPPGLPPGRAARALASRLAGRELSVTATGTACHVALPADPEAAVRDAWRAVTAAAGFPAVIAFGARDEAADALLAHADLLLLAAGRDADETLVGLALASLASLGPPADLVRPPTGPVTRRLAAAGLRPLPLAEAVTE